MDITLLSLALLPVLILLFYVYHKDKYNKEPLGLLLKTIFCGALCCIPAILLESFLSVFTPGDSFPIADGLYNGYVVAGCSEELCKLLMLTWVIWRNRHFDEYFDGIVYATFISLGFAGVENVMYVFNQSDYYQAISTGAMRAVMSVPGHFLFAVVMGYYFALAKFQPENRFSNSIKSFLYPALLHGTFDSLLMIPEGMDSYKGLITGVLFVVFVIFDIRLWKLGSRKLRHLQELSRQQSDQGGNFYQNDDDNYHDGHNDDPFKDINWDV